VPAKISVTELKRRFEEQTREETGEPETISGNLRGLVKKPLFLKKNKGLSPAEAGTALHSVMQHLDFYKGDLARQIGEMADRGLLTSQQGESVNPDQIRQFLESPLGIRLISSGSVSREVPFQMELPCYRLYPGMQENSQGETLLLQGVIDCYFEEEGGIVLLDYKTDYVPEEGTEIIRERYKVQIDYYARALELLTGKKVKEKYIYLFSIGETLEF
jgi:ATP-dependent helicase/nuclease subunit A